MIGTPYERQLLESLIAHSQIPELADLPRFGSSRSFIREAFGTPESESSTTLQYIREDGEAQPAYLTFRFAADALVELRYSFGVD
jgi:hypothetical protein